MLSQLGNQYDIDVDVFRKDLLTSGISDRSNFTSLNQASELLNATLCELMDKHCPLIVKQTKIQHLEAKLFDQDLRDLRKRRRAAERLKRKHNNEQNRINYIKIRNHFNKLVWSKKKAYYQTSLETSMGDKQALFKKNY